jgi:hypothetical protein
MKHTRRTAALLAVLCFPVGVLAQVTGSGTTNHIARWTGSTALGNSNIVENSNSACIAAHGGQPGPCVGIGVTNPAANLHIVGGESTGLLLESSVANGNPAITVQANTPAGQAAVNINRADGGAPARVSFGSSGSAEWFVEIPGGVTEQLNISNSSESALVTFLQTGQMGVGTQTPANTLEIVAGGTTLADAWTTRSSRQFKTNILPLAGALEKVMQIQGVSYQRKVDGKPEIGVVAEDVEQVVPEVVSHDPQTHEAQGVDYSRLAALLIEAVKTQQIEIQSQQAEIQQLKAQIGQMTSNPVVK